MDNSIKLSYKNYYLRTLTKKDVGEKYLRWVNDKEVTKYLEIKYNTYTHEVLLDYVSSFENTDTKFLFGVFTKEGDEHIGNATLYNIKYNTGTFDYGFLIGEKEYWGKNVGTETTLMLLKFGFEDLKLRKFFGGIYSNNTASRFVVHRIGFTKEARLRGRFLFEGKPIDQIVYSMDREHWVKIRKKFDI